GLFATDKDNIAGVNITHFTLCAVAGICRLNLNLSGQPLNWINTVPKVKISDNKPLYEGSKCICPLGGIISCMNSGQI
ncbi:PAAR-like protein, partial [Bacillus sp. SIMBA_033]